jgi:hypothetical protein
VPKRSGIDRGVTEPEFGNDERSVSDEGLPSLVMDFELGPCRLAGLPRHRNEITNKSWAVLGGPLVHVLIMMPVRSLLLQDGKLVCACACITGPR